jgi:hypothetical protein
MGFLNKYVTIPSLKIGTCMIENKATITRFLAALKKNNEIEGIRVGDESIEEIEQLLKESEGKMEEVIGLLCYLIGLLPRNWSSIVGEDLYTKINEFCVQAEPVNDSTPPTLLQFKIALFRRKSLLN